MRWRRFLGTTAVFFAFGGVTGCSVFAAPPVPPTIEVEPIAAPPWLLPANDSVDMASMILPRTDELPALVAGVVQRSDGTDVVTTWLASESTWEPNIVTDDVGSFWPLLAGSDDAAFIVGVDWKAGQQTLRAFRSTDRQSWSEVPIETSISQRFIGDVVVAVTGSRAAIAAVDPDGVGVILQVDGIRVSSSELPRIGDGERRSLTGLAADGDTLVLLARVAQEGRPSPTFSYRSIDLGKSWDPPVAFPGFGARNRVAGIATIDDGFIATGSQPVDEVPGASHEPAAWISDDGSKWHHEDVDVVSEGIDDIEFSPLGIPLAADGEVGAVMEVRSSTSTPVLRRDLNGVWSLAGASSTNADTGVSGVALPEGAGAMMALIDGGSFARLGVIGIDGNWSDVVTLANREDIGWVASFNRVGDSVEFTAERAAFSTDGSSWRSTVQVQHGRIEGAHAAFIPREPAPASELIHVVTDAAPDGTEVVIGSDFGDSSDILLTGWVRTPGAAEWSAMIGFETQGAATLDDVRALSSQWIARGSYRPSADPGEIEIAALWGSRDGIVWSRRAGEFADEALGSQVAGVCERADGTPMAVGSVERATAGNQIVVWEESASGVWSRVDLGELGDANGYALHCVESKDAVLMGVNADGRYSIVRTTDGEEFEVVFRAEQGMWLDDPVAIVGGFAAPGSFTRGSFTSPAVWLSRTGEDWKPVLVPSTAAGSTRSVVSDGDDLVIAMSGAMGAPMMRVSNIGVVLDKVAPR